MTEWWNIHVNAATVVGCLLPDQGAGNAPLADPSPDIIGLSPLKGKADMMKSPQERRRELIEQYNKLGNDIAASACYPEKLFEKYEKLAEKISELSPYRRHDESAKGLADIRGEDD